MTRRHRRCDRGTDVAAALTHAEGHVTGFAWERWHRKHHEPWTGVAETWAAAVLAADQAKPGKQSP
ncbi:hypothetical protein LO763_22090 [Glycomyces sp. A-F 0318]|uniref:hypothetical protein n=1 Tax=Glycomyces amatae TaxID=2881355 RepID=UPI001E41552B|nr:hypothetical protein [Glycomyces amatae]MCD0446308.1 hypothetical protein [Glycomyces amatae]